MRGEPVLIGIYLALHIGKGNKEAPEQGIIIGIEVGIGRQIDIPLTGPCLKIKMLHPQGCNPGFVESIPEHHALIQTGHKQILPARTVQSEIITPGSITKDESLLLNGLEERMERCIERPVPKPHRLHLHTHLTIQGVRGSQGSHAIGQSSCRYK